MKGASFKANDRRDTEHGWPRLTNKLEATRLACGPFDGNNLAFSGLSQRN